VATYLHVDPQHVFIALVRGRVRTENKLRQWGVPGSKSLNIQPEARTVHKELCCYQTSFTVTGFHAMKQAEEDDVPLYR